MPVGRKTRARIRPRQSVAAGDEDSYGSDQLLILSRNVDGESDRPWVQEPACVGGGDQGLVVQPLGEQADREP